MRALRRILGPVAAELGANARLRWGIWLIAGILLAYGILVQSERLAAAHRDYDAEAAGLARAAALLEGRDWSALLEAERETHGELEATFWRAETEGLAQAKLQDALTGIIEGLDFRDVLMRSGVSQPVPDLPGIWRVQTRLDAAYRGRAELHALHAIATHPKKLVVDRLDLRRRQRQRSHMVLILSAYFVGVEAEP